jgi:hypothetical protein
MKHRLEFKLERTAIVGLFLLTISIASYGGSGNWTSSVTGGNIIYTTSEPTTQLKDNVGNNLTVVYLENMGFNKIGGNTNATDVSWLLAQGYRVIELDYANNINAVSPKINADIITINDAINNGSFCGYTNCSKYRSYVLFEGYRIQRDVSYFKDDPTIYNYPANYTVGDSIFMDIIYPANASVTVPVVLSFSYSNSWGGSETYKHQRLNLGNTLAGFDDTFLEGAPANGIAWAIADHPKYCDWGQGKPVGGANKAYGSFEVNPDAAQKVKSAVRTLRARGASLGLSGKIGIYGFSRGSDAGSMAIGDRSVPSFENAGLHIGVSDDVQVAALGSGVFDFTQIFNATGDGDSNLETRCPVVWGPLATNQSVWESQGSANLVETSATAPVIFFYNTDDAAYYQDQIAKFKEKLTLKGVTHTTISNYGTGHAVPKTNASLSSLYTFFNQYLTPPNVATGLIPLTQKEADFQLTLSPNPVKSSALLTFQLANSSNVKIQICNLAGMTLFNIDRTYTQAGQQSETIMLNDMKLPNGVYFLKVNMNGLNTIKKFIKE